MRIAIANYYYFHCITADDDQLLSKTITFTLANTLYGKSQHLPV